MNKRVFFVLMVAIFALCLCFSGCTFEWSNPNTTRNSNTQLSDTQTNDSDTQSSNTTDTSSTNKEDCQDKPSQDEEADYFVARVTQDESLIILPYTADKVVGEELVGICYSSDTPGGIPQNNGEGKIWLTIKPLKDKCVDEIRIEGKYSHIEDQGNDLYCIYGVGSDLSVYASSKKLPNAYGEIFENYGYGISNEGVMTVSWVENTQDPIRYVEISYNDGINDCVEYIDGSKGSCELFEMIENRPYTISLRAIGYKSRGQSVSVEGCYMKAPKDVPFPRVEIVTENYVWPSCDFVQSPDGCWGAGITNAEYEQCIVTLYNESNEVVYTSTKGDNLDFAGAKMKIRGNTSARYASNGRFPYKIKLNKKADLLFPFLDRGEKDGYADKDWLLLNYGEDGYRITGDAVADAIGTAWSPDYCYVSLYVNGEYRGLYVLSEAVEEGNGEGKEQWRVGVENDGYVFECDAYWWNEDLSFSTPLTENTPMHFTFKYPDADELTGDSPELKYLRDYLIAFENALMRNDDSYLDYIDLDSFVKWLLVSDILCINDGGGCNIFLYKENSKEGTKLKMGPNWDFDSYMGNAYGLSTIRLKWNGAPFYYQYLIEKKSFQERYKQLFWELKDSVKASVENAFMQIDEENHYKLLQYDNVRFGTSLKSLSTRKNTFLEWLDKHIEWMEEQFK